MDPGCGRKLGQRVSRLQGSAAGSGLSWPNCWNPGEHFGAGALNRKGHKKADLQAWRNCAAHDSDKGLGSILYKEIYKAILKAPKPYKK